MRTDLTPDELTHYNRILLVFSLLVEASSVLSFLLIIYVMQLYWRQSKISHRRRKAHMEMVERQADEIIKRAWRSVADGSNQLEHDAF